MEVNAYVLRAVLARPDIDDEGAAEVGTSVKENLGNATTVEAALRHMVQFGNDLSGFNKYVSYLLTLGRVQPTVVGGAGITISGGDDSSSYRVDAKGVISTDYDIVTATIGGFVVIRPDLRFSNQWLMRFDASEVPNPPGPSGINVFELAAPLTYSNQIGETFTITVDSDSGIPPFPVAGFQWWTHINWPNGEDPYHPASPNPDFGGKTTFGFIRISASEWDGFVIGSKIPYP